MYSISPHKAADSRIAGIMTPWLIVNPACIFDTIGLENTATKSIIISNKIPITRPILSSSFFLASELMDFLEERIMMEYINK